MGHPTTNYLSLARSYARYRRKPGLSVYDFDRREAQNMRNQPQTRQNSNNWNQGAQQSVYFTQYIDRLYNWSDPSNAGRNSMQHRNNYYEIKLQMIIINKAMTIERIVIKDPHVITLKHLQNQCFKYQSNHQGNAQQNFQARSLGSQTEARRSTSPNQQQE